GENVGAAEGVDRLLGIADHEQAVVRSTLNEQTPEDSPLQVVGVLELVDQRAVKALTQDFGEILTAAAVQRAPHPGQHVVVIGQATLTLVALQAIYNAGQEKIDQFPFCGPD